MKAKYLGKEIILDDEVIPGRDEFDTDINLDDTIEIDYNQVLNLEKTKELDLGDENE